MKFEILDSKVVDSRTWILGKGNLYEYLEGLKEDFYNYSIQRKIVKNQYLDSLVKTVISGDPIPLITLTYSLEKEELKPGIVLDIDMKKVEILDGLQRTFRLWVYFKLIGELDKKPGLSITDFAKEIKAAYPFVFETGIISFSAIKELVGKDGFSEIKKSFKQSDLYFIIWGNLSKKEVIHKMLVLNAGQRSVSKTHQYELLFLYLWDDLEKQLKDVTLFREKDSLANEVKSGKREIGQYIFSSIIVGLRSFLEGRPLKVSGDLDIVGSAFEDDYKNINEEIFTVDYMNNFLSYLKQIDLVLFEKEGDEAKKWFVRETSIVGILSGLGEYLQISDGMSIEEIRSKTNEGFELLILKSKEHGFKLSQFRDQYTILYNRSVNVGTFIRKAIKDYTVELLKNKQPVWSSFFEKIKRSDL